MSQFLELESGPGSPLTLRTLLPERERTSQGEESGASATSPSTVSTDVSLSWRSVRYHGRNLGPDAPLGMASFIFLCTRRGDLEDLGAVCTFTTTHHPQCTFPSRWLPAPPSKLDSQSLMKQLGKAVQESRDGMGFGARWPSGLWPMQVTTCVSLELSPTHRVVRVP